MRKFHILYCITALGFLLGIHSGNIALWVGDDPEPAAVFPYSASMLPEADQKLLEKGLKITSRQELTRRLEDYLS